jgi:hypothetical protein
MMRWPGDHSGGCSAGQAAGRSGTTWPDDHLSR